MAEQKAPQMQATLGLTGLTSNAMALIAPGAFLWLTFFIQATTGVAGQPSTAPGMWIGIFAALVLCLATAIAYAEISKLYPGTGSSYYYAEQAMLSKDKAFKYARVAKFIVGWGSHLYYWVYPGVMVAVTGVFVGYVIGFLYPNVMSGSNPGPVFMALVAVVFSFFVAWIASKGAGASTAVNLAINVVQISALIVFSVLALGYRSSLEIVNMIAPADRRAGLVSVYLVICFIGNALPVIGVAILTAAIGPVAASEIFALVMLALAVLAFVTGLRFAPHRPARPGQAG